MNKLAIVLISATAFAGVANAQDARATGTGFNDIDIDAYDGGTLLGSIAANQAWGGFATFGFGTGLLDGVTDARIRFSFTGSTSSGGTNRYDNFFIEGNQIPAPGAAALFGLAGLTASRRRRG